MLFRSCGPFLGPSTLDPTPRFDALSKKRTLLILSLNRTSCAAQSHNKSDSNKDENNNNLLISAVEFIRSYPFLGSIWPIWSVRLFSQSYFFDFYCISPIRHILSLGVLNSLMDQFCLPKKKNIRNIRTDTKRAQSEIILKLLPCTSAFS